jgi:hypothetical protein
MGAVMITAIAQKEAAKQALLKQLREYGATSPQMPRSLDVESDEAQAALAELLASGGIREARPGLFYLDEAKAKEASPGNSFVALLAILVIISFTASLVALAVSGG